MEENCFTKSVNELPYGSYWLFMKDVWVNIQPLNKTAGSDSIVLVLLSLCILMSSQLVEDTYFFKTGSSSYSKQTQAAHRRIPLLFLTGIELNLKYLSGQIWRKEVLSVQMAGKWIILQFHKKYVEMWGRAEEMHL